MTPGAWRHHQGLPKGSHSSCWDLAGVRAGYSLGLWLPKPFPFPGHCSEKVTWLDTCLCQGRTQPDCCCDPWREVILLAGSPLESSQSHRQPATGKTSSDACAFQHEMNPTHNPLSHPSSHLQGGAQPSPVPSNRPAALASCSSQQLDYCPGGVSSETRQGTAQPGESLCLP